LDSGKQKSALHNNNTTAKSFNMTPNAFTPNKDDLKRKKKNIHMKNDSDVQARYSLTI
jgi:hypothetical protein